jgi:hypothetical protein
MKHDKIIGVKEIKSIEITPFSLMASSIEAILAFLTAVFTLIIFEATTVISHFNIYSNVITSFDVAFIIISPISGFFIILAVSYFSILLYNILTPLVGGVNIGLDNNEITHIPLLSFSLILAIIEGIWAFIIGLLIFSTLPVLNTLLHTSTLIISTIININTLGLNPIKDTSAMSPLLIIGLPLAVFIMGFTYNILIAVLYNYFGPKIGKFKLEFVNVKKTVYELKSIPVNLVPIALATGIVLAALGFLVELMSIIGLIDLITLSNLGNLLGSFAFRGDVIIYVIPTFIIVTLVAVFYNYLVPVIGGVKLEME